MPKKRIYRGPLWFGLVCFSALAIVISLDDPDGIKANLGNRIVAIAIACMAAALLMVTYLIRRAPCGMEKESPNQPVQHNAGSRPPSDDSPASETPSSLGPRG